METAFQIKDSVPVGISDFNFQLTDDGEIQSLRLETANPYSLEVAKDIKAVLDKHLEDYNLNLSPMQGRVQVRVQ
jgi:hypothetical protein